jgi:HEAT repeat protein
MEQRAAPLRRPTMKDLWMALEERTRTWDALRRQGLADSVWRDYVSVRFRRTGDPRALEYLYPYLNHADQETRRHAIDAAATVFEGRGAGFINALGYFTTNPDLFLRDRAVIVVGAAVTGSRDEVILEALTPYLNSPNLFVRKLALVALGKAAAGQASARVLAQIRRVGQLPGPREDEVRLAIATAFAGRPTEEVWSLVAGPQQQEKTDRDAGATAVLARGASEEWYQRACAEVFEPRLHADEATDEGTGWKRGLILRGGVTALCHAGAEKGMEPLSRMLHLRGGRAPGHALFRSAPELFASADPAQHRDSLIELARRGDVSTQRIAAVCLGRLVTGLEDETAIAALRELSDAKSKAVQAAALSGLGMAARSTCDDGLRRLCLDRFVEHETATAAMGALGMIFLGSGRRDVFAEIRDRATMLREAPVRSRQYCKPLAACYRAAGLLYLGTGSVEPVEFLLDVLAHPPRRYDEYRWAAAESLVMVEFTESALGWEYISPV